KRAIGREQRLTASRRGRIRLPPQAQKLARTGCAPPALPRTLRRLRAQHCACQNDEQYPHSWILRLFFPEATKYGL
ncbi:MAG: hypothetical protein ACRD5Z_13790, partial [Bryobacteraceae bacterium]